MYIKIDRENITMSHDLMVEVLENAFQRGHALPKDADPRTYKLLAEGALAIMIKSYSDVHKESQN